MNSKTVAADRVLIVRYDSPESNKCFIEDQALSPSYDLAALPPPPPLSRQQAVSHSQSSCVHQLSLLGSFEVKHQNDYLLQN
jgi:hypothetical protein